MAINKVLIVSAGGTLGAAIVNALQLKGGYEITGLTSQNSKAVPITGIKHIRSDYSSESLTKAFTGQDIIISAISGAGLAAQKAMIDVAIQCQVKWFIPSEYGLDTSLPRAQEEIPFLGTKIEVLDILKANQDKISWTVVCSGNLFDWGLQIPGFGGFNVPAKTAVLYDGGDSEFEATTIGQVADAVVKILDHSDVTKNQYVYVNSFTVTQRKILAALEKATESKFSVSESTVAELRPSAFERMNKGEVAGLLDVIAAAMYSVPDLARYSQTKGLWNDKLGLESQDLYEEVVKAVGTKSK